MGLIRKVAVLGAAVSFARSEQGKKVLAETRQRVDTPANRDRAKQAAQEGVRQVRKQMDARKAR